MSPALSPTWLCGSADLVSLCCLGFKEQIYDVYRYLPPATQVVLISATLPHEILEMTNKFMTDPIRILVKRSVCPAHGGNAAGRSQVPPSLPLCSILGALGVL